MKPQRPYKRSDRVSAQICEILGEISIKDINLSHLGFVTFSEVKLTSDLKEATVYFSVIEPKFPIDRLTIEINKLQKAFRKYLGKELRIKSTPKLKFLYDDTFEYQSKINKIMHDINETDNL